MATYSVISKAQLDKIRDKVAPVSADSAAEERKRLKQQSDERSQQWPNTLTAQRARKEKTRQERQAAEEAERVELDRQEAELRAEQRRVQIERANKILFDETDRVKAFHSKMLLSDVMQENEQLQEIKRQIEVLKRAQEQAFVEQQRQALEAEEMRRKEEDKAARARQLAAESKAANAALQSIRLKEVERAKEQELAIDAYTKKKAELADERARREREKRDAKEAEKQRLADSMQANIQDVLSREDARVARDVAAAEAKRLAEAEAKLRKAAELAAAIDTSRQAQLRAKAASKAAERADEADFHTAWSARTKALKAEDDEEKLKRMAVGRQLAAFQLRQAALKARRMANARVAELQEAAQMALSVQEEEDIFLRYAAECIDEYRRLGKPTVPMELHLRKKTTIETMR
ncbi:hypothetical protein TSOC_006245 [Tetrabaena socialis]|uniref:Trichohyalin-plectin-homology domain-containing protein n=1 Tax=Tetrabaena socialis TaxID=47790 RepID=A0A2J8A4D6_9CHLO|nr:hypothetical protein TSOC_006245 [Tetrabaena socialis]|eukprot:PNH07368.1 hypothetical protein TSOC_006245 [Tetrabaena socialis]